MSLEERVVAAEVASRRAGGVHSVIEVQSRRRSDAAGQGLVRGVRPDADLGAVGTPPAWQDRCWLGRWQGDGDA